MSKSNSFIKNLKNINHSINSLLERNLNKLKFNNLINLARSNKIVLTVVALIMSSICYLLIPNFYKQADILKELNSELSNKLNLDFKFTKNLKYNVFPRPHFISDELVILYDKSEISKIKKTKIYISLENLFSLEQIKINQVILENANFNLNNQNFDFFIKLLENKFNNLDLNIINSNIFFRDTQNEVLFINKILKMKYYYDPKIFQSILSSENKIFNVPYNLELFKDKYQKRILSKVNFKFLKLQIENEFNFSNEVKNGKSDLLFNKSKSIIDYKLDKKEFSFSFYDKLENPKFSYKGMFNLNPFFSSFEGKTQELNSIFLFNTMAFIPQILKTEILNNKNIEFESSIDANKFSDNLNFTNIFLNFRIQEGLIDIDNSRLSWKSFADFKFSDSLIFVKNGELVLDGKLKIDISNYDEIYKYLLTPKNFRKKLKKIDLNFSYNFDKKSMTITDIKINNQYNQSVNKILSDVILRDDNLQNKIYLKKLLNNAIKSYAG